MAAKMKFFGIISDMKGAVRVALALAAAVVIGGVAGYAVVDGLVLRRPQRVVEAMARSKAAQTAGDVAKRGGAARRAGEARRGGCAEKIVADEPPRLHRWIAEAKVGPYRLRAVKVVPGENGTVVVRQIGVHEARRGFGIALRNARARSAKPPKEERWAQRVCHASGRAGYESDCAPGIYPGDVYLSGIPMINQGGKAYCAVASAARVLQNYGIEITMDEMAELAGSSETGGTSIMRWERALKQVANNHGHELRIVNEVSETQTPLSQTLYNYNLMARNMGEPELDAAKYLGGGGYAAFDHDYDYAVQREAVLSNDMKTSEFKEKVKSRIDDSDPLLWSVLLGDVPEQVPGGMMTADERTGHMRILIGYNEDRGEVLYSDSWGEEHELKRMDMADAISITKGLYYLSD